MCVCFLCFGLFVVSSVCRLCFVCLCFGVVFFCVCVFLCLCLVLCVWVFRVLGFVFSVLCVCVLCSEVWGWFSGFAVSVSRFGLPRGAGTNTPL